jgi:CubicO group peptidase (beta-lactamase class C family)
MHDLPWPEGSWDEVIAAVCARRREPRWVPGKKAGYHHASSWFILGELVQRLDGRPFPRYVEEEVFAPLGMSDGSIGLPAERYRQLERDGRIARSWDMTGAAPVLYPWHEEAYVTRPSPGGNGRGPLSQLGRLYEALLAGGELDGHRVLSRAAVEALTARHRAGLYDHTFKHVLDWGLGVIVNARHYALIAGPGTPAASDRVPYGYGPHASYRTFGHSGYRSVVAFGDPEQHLAVALAWNGLPTDPQHEARLHRTLETLYAELDLAAVD